MADVTAQEPLLELRIADASWFYKLYLTQEKKILGLISVSIFLVFWEFLGGAWSIYNPIAVLRVNPMFMSAPSLVAKAAYGLFAEGEIYHDLYVSGTEFFWGYLLS